MRVGERKAMTDTTIAAVSAAVPLIFQVGATGTENAVELARYAVAAGADAIASVAPVDHPNNLQAAVQHYAAIGAATDRPFYVYWIAQTADATITAEQYLEAMEAVPNFSGLKFTDSNFYFFQRLDGPCRRPAEHHIRARRDLLRRHGCRCRCSYRIDLQYHAKNIPAYAPPF